MRNSLPLAALILAAIVAAIAVPCYAQDQPAAGAAPAAPPEEKAPKPVIKAPTFYVATTGNDAWSGKLPEINAEKSDGPFATLNAARDALRELRKNSDFDGPATVQVRGGLYWLTDPFSLQAEDSGTPESPVIYTAYPGERPIFSGGKTISGWKKEGNLWTASLPEITSSDWRFHSIWVDGKRRGVCRTPNEGFFKTAGRAPATENTTTGDKIIQSNVAFRFKAGDVKRWENLDDALVVVLHSWETSFHHVSAIDEEKRIITFRNAARWTFEEWGPEQRYYVINTPEGLDAPGEWYANRQTGVVSYFPMPDEDLSNAEVVAPFLKQLVQFDGNPATGQYVRWITMNGLHFYHAGFAVGPDGFGDAQGAVSVPAAIQLRGTQYCSVEGCEVAHADTYGIWVRAGSFCNTIRRNEIQDMGAGGIRIGEQQHSNDTLEALHNIVDNNFIHGGGYVFRSGVGVWIGQSPLNSVTHNDISDLSNSAITVGWAWGKEQGYSNCNLIEFNRLHNIGNGEFSNMAGVYILGGSWNSIVRNNLIHDVAAYLYGGWGIHADEGSSNLSIENNIAYNTTSGGFDQFYGNLNRVQNNVFAFSHDAQVGLSSAQNPQPILFERNIIITNNGTPFGNNWESGNTWHYSNCYWDTDGWDMDFCGGSFKDWQNRGRDAGSIFADPMFEDIKAFDFRLKPGSPALAIGIRSLDLSSAGLYGDPAWTGAPAAVTHAAGELSKALAARPIAEDFEALTADELPPGISVFGADGQATIKVTEETAAAGKKSLKITDSEGPQEEWQPELCYLPRFRDGKAVCSFDLRLEPGASMQHDWRADWTGRRAGPRIAFDDNGGVHLGGDEKTVMQVPQSQWFHVELECNLGKAAANPATYTLTITVPGQDPKRIDNIPCVYTRFRAVERLWFLSTAKKDTAYYLDNVKLEQR